MLRAGALFGISVLLIGFSSACGGSAGQEAGKTVTVTVFTSTEASPETQAPPTTEPSEESATTASEAVSEAELVPVKMGVSQGDAGEIGYGIVLKNRSASHDAVGVTVTVNILDAQGDIVATEAETLNVIPAGELYYLGGATYGDEATKAMELEPIIEVDASEPASYPLPTVQRLKISTDQYIGYRVRGEVMNNLDQPLSSLAKIGIVLFDKAGNVVGGGFTFLDADLPPGRRAGFEAGNGISAAPKGQVASAKASVDNDVAG